MKAISIKQPWANMIRDGLKTIETRTRSTTHRGELLICSSKSPSIYPAGYALAIVDLMDCRPMEKADEEAARCEVYPGAWAWVLRNVRPISIFPVRGQLGLFEAPTGTGQSGTYRVNCDLSWLTPEMPRKQEG